MKVEGQTRVHKCEQHERRKWTSVASAVAVEFEKATFEELKEGTRLILMEHCAGLLNAGEA